MAAVMAAIMAAGADPVSEHDHSRDAAAVVVRFSRAGVERVWCHSLTVAEDASMLHRRFAAVGDTAPEEVRLKVVPARPGGEQAEVKGLAGQSLLSFLEEKCRQSNSAFHLRADFKTPSSDRFVQVRIALPGTATSAAAVGSGEPPPMLIEQFECDKNSTIASLKALIERRTRFPMSHGTLLLGCRRLHDELVMQNVAAAAKAAHTVLQLHIAACGAFLFLRREGQGHRELTGPCELTVLLPPCVHGARERRMPFDPAQRLSEFRHCVQSLCGVHASGMVLLLNEAKTKLSDEGATLESLGVVTGCRVYVERTFTEASDMPFDTPSAGSTASLYEKVAQTLGVEDVSRLALFVGAEPVSIGADLSCAPIADGVVLSAYMVSSVELPFSVLTRARASSSQVFPPLEEDGQTDPSSLPTPSVACLSSDTVAEVQERVIGAIGSASAEAAARLRGSRVFAVDRAKWTSGGSAVDSLGALARLLGHFTPLSRGSRLSQLGLAKFANGHLIFVPERQLHLEISLHVAGDLRATRKLRVPSTTRLSQLCGILESDVHETPIAECPAVDFSHCYWVLGSPEELGTSLCVGTCDEKASSSSVASTRSNVAEMVGNAAAAVQRKRKSFGGALDLTPRSAEKRSKPNPPQDCLPADEFAGDLHALRPQPHKDLEKHYLCPISYEVMRDPVLVVGSGNTYDRKSIESHFAKRHSDPLTNLDLKRASERRLVPNNTLRSQIDEAERSQVDLRLTAFFSEQRGACSGDAAVGAYLGWCTSWLRGSA
jgi:hypothetical protein